MSTIVKIGKKAKKLLKNFIISAVPIHVSYARRLEKVKTTEKICAMTFDDGPMLMPANPDHHDGKALTAILLDTLKEYDAKGTFDIIGDTSTNYPDIAGKINTAQWGGIAFDHYPDINKDDKGGAVHTHDLMNRIVREGHQLTNHSYEHRLFGKKPFVYGKRIYFNSFEEIVNDMEKLDLYVLNNFNYKMTMSRPPHYVDGINGGYNSYDVYTKVNYQYLAAPYDGAGWLPSTSASSDAANYELEVKAMYEPMERLLAKDANALCGQIIFQKDGYNMAKRTPVADGLAKQLDILKKYGYKVVTVDELLAETPFEDIGREDPDFAKMNELIKTRAIAYSNNKLALDNIMSLGELAMLIAPKEVVVNGITPKKPYKAAMDYCMQKGYISSSNVKGLVDAKTLEAVKEFFDADNEIEKHNFTRRSILRAVKI